ncbi:hypothetical protein HOLleu_07892 [Holothuria leucospilota]|uniref:Uncharacterized protein n=1 Tax=Holothuria leucospilota TaxID=206669 RepID=A0A9Q1CHE0_HOLLE|nr:hypothetical protein HOLleu_07892 [Holothuria leucospilota]
MSSQFPCTDQAYTAASGFVLGSFPTAKGCQLQTPEFSYPNTYKMNKVCMLEEQARSPLPPISEKNYRTSLNVSRPCP